MQIHPGFGKSELVVASRKLLHLLREEYERDTLIMAALPILIVVGAILGIINVLAIIHLVAVFING